MGPFSLPETWARDELTLLMEHAHRNRVATFVNKPEFQRLIEIEKCFREVSLGWLNPSDRVGALLLMRSHASFFAACEMAAASMLAETFPHIRSCIENAGYALHINLTPGLAETWLRRHDDDKSKAAVRAAFAVGKVRASISSKDRHTAKVFDRLYEEAVDFGAHPNERSVTGSLRIQDTEQGHELHQLWFHGDGPALDLALVTTGRAGICALQILQNVFPARFELLGVNAAILSLRRGL